MTAYYNEKVERMSAEEKKALQSERLVQVVKRVYDNVPTYRAKMDAIGLKPEDIKSIDDITKLPFTTKSDLRNNYPFGMFASPLKDIVRLHASSGTTGKLTVAGCTQHDLDDWSEAVARGFVSCGVSRESVIHVARSARRRHSARRDGCSRFRWQHQPPAHAHQGFRRGHHLLHAVLCRIPCRRIQESGYPHERTQTEARLFRSGTVVRRNAR